MISEGIVFFYVFTLLSAYVKGERINPKSLLVTTVIDVSNEEIVRDSLTLFRSIRLFGESLNNAAFLAYITLEDTFVDTYGLLSNLTALHIQWDFIKPVPPHLPRTMNKFQAFQKFDSLKYDYLMWLDADVVLFQDPIPHLFAHRFPGQIQCTPDFYYYLNIFPTLNESDLLVRSMAMPEYQLIGERDGDHAPHGLCNTGVLLFDRLSLAAFNGALNSTLEQLQPLQLHSEDRFMDSLLFVSIVNRLNIDVIVQGYELNYLSYFEAEIQESAAASGAPLGAIVFAHLITYTELYCWIDALKSCLCAYRNASLKYVKTSLIGKEMSKFKVPDVCRVMAGSLTMHQFESLGHKTSISFASRSDSQRQQQNQQPPSLALPSAVGGNFTPLLELVWPPHGGLVLHKDASVHVPVQLQWTCAPYATSTPAAPAGAQVADDVNVTLSLYEAAGVSLWCRSRLVLKACHDVPILTSVDCTLQIGKEGTKKSKKLGNFGETRVRLELALSLRDWGVESQEGKADCGVEFILFEQSTAPRGVVKYSDNILLGSRPIQLDTQLHLPSYLSVWGHGRRERYGVVVCCESATGVGVVERLISAWAGDVLVIHLRRAPAYPPPMPVAAGAEVKGTADENEGAGSVYRMDKRRTSNSTASQLVQEWTQYFTNLCRARRTQPLRCAVFDASVSVPSEGSDAFLTGEYSLQSSRLSFVYIDVYEDYHSHRDRIVSWLQLLPKGGLLIGSRYSDTCDTAGFHYQRSQPELLPWQEGVADVASGEAGSTDRAPEPLRCLPGPRAAVDAAAFAAHRGVLATYAEESSGASWSGANWLCRELRNHQHMLIQPLAAVAETTVGAVDYQGKAQTQGVATKAQPAVLGPIALRATESDCAPAWYFQLI